MPFEFSQVDQYGRVVNSGTTLAVLETPGLTNLKEKAPANSYRSGDAWVSIPDQPSVSSTWDWPSHTWLDDLADARSRAGDRIEAARGAATNSPIAYDGASLDADKTAQDNISNKLLEIQEVRKSSGTMPAELMFWRDHDNTLHTFDSLDAYDSWLGGLAIAITRRGTAAYAWAWGQKSALVAAVTLADIEAIPAPISL